MSKIDIFSTKFIENFSNGIVNYTLSFLQKLNIGTKSEVTDADVTIKTVGLRDNSGTFEVKNNGASWAAIGSSMNDLVDDTTPQLGGNLDLNGNNIDFPTTAGISDCLDEDDMSSNSASSLSTQQSIKAYSDNKSADLQMLGFVDNTETTHRWRGHG